MRVNTLPPYQHCLIDTRHLKHAEELPDLSHTGTMKLSTMLSEGNAKREGRARREGARETPARKPLFSPSRLLIKNNANFE